MNRYLYTSTDGPLFDQKKKDLFWSFLRSGDDVDYIITIDEMMEKVEWMRYDSILDIIKAKSKLLGDQQPTVEVWKSIGIIRLTVRAIARSDGSNFADKRHLEIPFREFWK